MNTFQMKTLILLLMMIQVVRSQRPRIRKKRINPSQWNPEENGAEDTYMEFTSHWKKEIIAWSKDCIREIKNRMYQMDHINYLAADDLRHVLGMTLGRILEIHRQQVDMYRRMKRIVENRFNWIRPELSGKYPQLAGQDGVVEPSHRINAKEYDKLWARGAKQTSYDYKPHVYIVALEYITKRETDIEHLVKLLTDYTGEEEVARFPPNDLVGGQEMPVVWNKYKKYVFTTPYKSEYEHNIWRSGQQVSPPDTQEEEEVKQRAQEEELKAKMRAEYFKKRGNSGK